MYKSVELEQNCSRHIFGLYLFLDLGGNIALALELFCRLWSKKQQGLFLVIALSGPYEPGA